MKCAAFAPIIPMHATQERGEGDVDDGGVVGGGGGGGGSLKGRGRVRGPSSYRPRDKLQ